MKTPTTASIILIIWKKEKKMLLKDFLKAIIGNKKKIHWKPITKKRSNEYVIETSWEE